MIRIMITMMALFLTNNALASNLFDPSSNDIMMKILSQMFGSIMPSGGIDAFGQAMTVFNGAIVMIGGILATYTLIAGTLGTAHDGEMLGKKFSSVWIPIRYAIGTALLVPVANGYSVVQMLVAWLIVQGNGLADNVWSAYMNQPYQSSVHSVQKSTQNDIKDLAEKIFLSQMCLRANQQSINMSDSILDKVHQYEYGMAFDTDKNTYNFGDQNGMFGIGSDSCGSVKLPTPTTTQQTAQPNKTTYQGRLGSFDSLFTQANIQPINVAQKTATLQLINDMGVLADKVASDNQTMNNQLAKQYFNQIQTASNKYIQTLQASANQVQNQQAVTSKASDYGWIMGGAYYMNIIQTDNKIFQAISNTPTASIKLDNHSDSSKGLNSIGLQIISSGDENYSGLGQRSGEETTNADMSWDGKIINVISKYFTGLDFGNVNNDARSPILILNDMGNQLLSGYVHLIIALLGISVLSGGVGAILGIMGPLAKVAGAVVSGIGNALMSAIALLFIPLSTVIVIAFMAGYAIPMMPFIYYLGVVISYILLVIVAMVGAPLWVISMLYPNNSELGASSHGFMMLLRLLLKPALIVFGMIASLNFVDLLGEFINKVIFQVFAFETNSTLMGFFGVVFGVAIYTYIMWFLVKKSFSLLGYINDDIFKFIGGTQDTSSGHADQAGSGLTGAVAQTAGILGSSKLGESVKGLGDKMFKDLNSMKDKYNDLQKKDDDLGGVPKAEQGEMTPDVANTHKSYNDLQALKKEQDVKEQALEQAQASKAINGSGVGELAPTANLAESTVADQAGIAPGGTSQDTVNPSFSTLTGSQDGLTGSGDTPTANLAQTSQTSGFTGSQDGLNPSDTTITRVEPKDFKGEK